MSGKEDLANEKREIDIEIIERAQRHFTRSLYTSLHSVSYLTRLARLNPKPYLAGVPILVFASATIFYTTYHIKYIMSDLSLNKLLCHLHTSNFPHFRNNNK